MVNLPAENTLLVIYLNDTSGEQLIPLYAARGLTQSLGPIDAAKQMRRTINGELINVAFDPFKKYTTSITCTDRDAPAFSKLWPGALIVVDCVTELAYRTGGTPERPVVPGSERVVGNFTYFRPRLTMRVMNNPNSMAEWQADNNWTLEAEEV